MPYIPCIFCGGALCGLCADGNLPQLAQVAMDGGKGSQAIAV